MIEARTRTRSLSILVALGALLLLGANTASYWADLRLSVLPSSRRYVEDLSVAIRLYLDASNPGGRVPGQPSEELGRAADKVEVPVRRLVKRDGIQPWQFWRTFGPRLFEEMRGDLAPARSFEDQGRARLLSLGFRALGGISPFLLLWLGALAAAPVIIWVSWEFFKASHGLAATVFLLTLGASPFVTGILSLPHAGIGFYLVAWLALLALACHGLLGEPSLRSLGIRALAAGLVFAVAVPCRGGVVLLGGGFILTLVLAGRRLRRPALVPLVGAVLVFGPYLVERPAEHHNVWPSIWEGLGDFDREKGYAWSDREAKAALSRAGVDSGSSELYGFVGEACETYFRNEILGDIRSDPGWYARILVERLAEIVSQSKLERYAARNLSILPDPAPNEGNIDKYYRFTTPVDRFGLGRRRLRIPMPSFAGAATILFGLAVLGLAHPDRKALRELRRPAALLLVAAAALLPSPLLITTASALETEMFALCYFLAAAFLLEWCGRSLHGRPLETRAGANPVPEP